jgi:hypothetical protein
MNNCAYSKRASIETEEDLSFLAKLNEEFPCDSDIPDVIFEGGGAAKAPELISIDETLKTDFNAQNAIDLHNVMKDMVNTIGELKHEIKFLKNELGYVKNGMERFFAEVTFFLLKTKTKKKRSCL